MNLCCSGRLPEDGFDAGSQVRLQTLQPGTPRTKRPADVPLGLWTGGLEELAMIGADGNPASTIFCIWDLAEVELGVAEPDSESWFADCMADSKNGGRVWSLSVVDRDPLRRKENVG